MRLGKSFFMNDAETLAKMLVGKLICVNCDNSNDSTKILKMRITETECYMGTDDTACHASKGMTERNMPLWLPGGYTYVYLCYGMYYMFNVVSGKENDPQAVLIRGVEGHFGPGKFTKYAGIDKSFNKIDMDISERIFIEDDGYMPDIVESERVGIDYAKEKDRMRLWRFTDSRYVSEHKSKSK